MLPKLISIGALAQLTGVSPGANLVAVHAGLRQGGELCGLTKPHRLVPYLAQLGHESMDYRYDRELWGPTPAQQRYDTRVDLGNTPARDGDGYLFRGHTAIQITGRANTCAFRDWARVHFGVDRVPDFEANPALMLTDPWEGLGPIWYWSTRWLNRWADEGDFAGLTRAINGGLNGYTDRCHRYARIALVALGYGPLEVMDFQADRGLLVDGDPGPKTRAAMHRSLCLLPSVSFGTQPVPTEPLVFPELPAKTPTLSLDPIGVLLSRIVAWFSALLTKGTS